MNALQTERRVPLADSIAWRLQAEIDAKEFQRAAARREARRFDTSPAPLTGFNGLISNVDRRSGTRWIENELVNAQPEDIGFKVGAGSDDDGEPSFDYYALTRSQAAVELRMFRKAHRYIERRGNNYFVEMK